MEAFMLPDPELRTGLEELRRGHDAINASVRDGLDALREDVREEFDDVRDELSSMREVMRVSLERIADRIDGNGDKIVAKMDATFAGALVQAIPEACRALGAHKWGIAVAFALAGLPALCVAVLGLWLLQDSGVYIDSPWLKVGVQHQHEAQP